MFHSYFSRLNKSSSSMLPFGIIFPSMFLNPPDSWCSCQLSIAFSNGGDPSQTRVSSRSLSTSPSVPFLVWALFPQKQQCCTQQPTSAHAGYAVCASALGSVPLSETIGVGYTETPATHPTPVSERLTPTAGVPGKCFCSLKLQISASWLPAFTSTDLEATPIAHYLLTEVTHFKPLAVLP